MIADLSTNYVERFMLRAGFSVNRIEKDYGYDLLVSTHDDNGEIENGFVLLQLKASDSPSYLTSEDAVSYSTDRSDLETWTEELYPVILVLYDAQRVDAYWLYIQHHLANHDIEVLGKTLSVRIPLTQKFDDSTPLRLAQYKQRIYDQLKEEVNHV